MRILAELPLPEFKVSIFSMNNKFIIKLEKGVFEQIYKIPELDVPDGINGVFKLIDPEFVRLSNERFNSMRQDFGQAFQRYDAL